MKILAGLLVILAVGAGSTWYFLFGQTKGLKRRGKPINNITAQAQTPAAQSSELGSPQPGGPEPEAHATTGSAPLTDSPAEAVSRTIRVQPTKETVEDFPAFIDVTDGSNQYHCQYTGQFRRTKKIIVEIKTYDIASYVVEPSRGQTLELLDGLLVDGKAKVYMLRFISSLTGKMIMNDIYDRINSSFDDVDVDRLQQNIENFVSVFQNGSKPGDIVYIVWLPGGKVYSAFNSADPVPFIAHDFPFARALWRIWAGPTFGDVRFNLVRRFADPVSTP
ncbi:chalcone isomerase family protein [bacterium]|nr:chalcone isomerase family protein [bacterium]